MITQQQREDIVLAAVNCEHQIDADCIRLYRDPTKAGSALSQMVDRVAAVVAQSVPDLDTMRTDFHQWCATNGYKTGFVNGGECPMGRPVYEDHRTHAAWWAFQKAVKLYGAQSAQPALRIAPDETVKDAAERYYIASYKRKSLDGCVTWWGPNHAGYTTDLTTAGTYSKEDADEICSGYTAAYTVAVPASLIETLRVRRSVDPGDSLNEAFWNADKLRAAIDSAMEKEKAK